MFGMTDNGSCSLFEEMFSKMYGHMVSFDGNEFHMLTYVEREEMDKKETDYTIYLRGGDFFHLPLTIDDTIHFGLGDSGCLICEVIDPENNRKAKFYCRI